MALDEFSLIRQFFTASMPANVLGPGDDAARVPMTLGAQLVVTKDLLIEGQHFFPNVTPLSLGYKSLAVNLSDLAAMGATPVGCLLGLGLPKADPVWLQGFSEGFLSLSQAAQCPLVGGDTVRAQDLAIISVTALGALPSGQTGLLRSGAQVGDDIWVSGYLGAAHIALLGLQGDDRISAQRLEQTRHALEKPQPRLALGQGLLNLAHSAIDISDGFVQDLGHVLTASVCGATIDYAAMPIHPALLDIPLALQQEAVLSGGDVFELCFTAPESNRAAVLALGKALNIQVTRVGAIEQTSGLRVLDQFAQPIKISYGGFDHFKDHEKR